MKAYFLLMTFAAGAATKHLGSCTKDSDCVSGKSCVHTTGQSWSMCLSKTPQMDAKKSEVAVWQQCGGVNYKGDTSCTSGNSCVKVNDWYFQCQPIPAGPNELPTWSQCAGYANNFNANGKTCRGADKCVKYNDAYSQCVPNNQHMNTQTKQEGDDCEIVQQLYDTHNAARVANGVEAYTCLDSKLSSLSMDHVNYEIEIGDINHDGMGERCNQAGPDLPACAENTLYDYDGIAQKMTDSWMASPGHRENILNPSYNHAGFAVKKSSDGRYYATAMFTQDSRGCPE